MRLRLETTAFFIVTAKEVPLEELTRTFRWRPCIVLHINVDLPLRMIMLPLAWIASRRIHQHFMNVWVRQNTGTTESTMTRYRKPSTLNKWIFHKKAHTKRKWPGTSREPPSATQGAVSRRFENSDSQRCTERGFTTIWKLREAANWCLLSAGQLLALKLRRARISKLIRQI